MTNHSKTNHDPTRCLLFNTLFYIINFKLRELRVLETCETPYAQIGKEMVDKKYYLHPKLLDAYTITTSHSLGIKLQLRLKFFGINEFAVRFLGKSIDKKNALKNGLFFISMKIFKKIILLHEQYYT